MKYILLALAGWASAAFIIWRLREATMKGVMRVRGATFARGVNPSGYWVNFVSAIVGLILPLGIAITGSWMLTG